MVAETLSLNQKFKLEQEHGPGPEQSTSTTKSRSKRQSQCSARAQSWSPGHSPSSRFLRQKPRDGREVRRPGAKERRHIKRSGAAVVEAKQRVQLQKTRPPAPLHIPKAALYGFRL